MALPIVNAPKYSMTVPSTGEMIEYRPYLVKEEKILMLAMESQDEISIMRAIIDTIGNCTDGKVDALHLTPQDIEYMFLQLRSKSVGETSKLKFKCSECDTYNEVQVNLSDVEAPELKKGKDLIVEISDDIKIQMRYPDMAVAMDIMKTKGDDTKTVDQAFDSIVSAIDIIYYGDETLYAKDHSKKELLDFVESMNNEQFQKLVGFIGDGASIKTQIVFDCSGCGHHNDREVKGLQNFFG